MSDIIVTERRNRVLLITLNRPRALNALNLELANAVIDAATEADADPGIGCLVITGSAKAFAAGADIKEMQGQTYSKMYDGNWFAQWDRFAALRAPIIAAVAGYALGGGCELALMCDMIVAADTARFGQPEITIGTVPGMGGSQRLTHAVGKAKAMDMCLTGRQMGADEAERAGLVARIVPADRLIEEAMAMAATIAAHPLATARMVKECVLTANELGLTQGLKFERRMFHASFATADQKEGMAAFVEKRPPVFHAVTPA